MSLLKRKVSMFLPTLTPSVPVSPSAITDCCSSPGLSELRPFSCPRQSPWAWYEIQWSLWNFNQTYNGITWFDQRRKSSCFFTSYCMPFTRYLVVPQRRLKRRKDLGMRDPGVGKEGKTGSNTTPSKACKIQSLYFWEIWVVLLIQINKQSTD